MTTPIRRPPKAGRQRRRPRPARFGLPLLPALLLSILSGFVLAAAYPSLNLWILAFPGVAGLLVSLRGRSFWGAVLVGLAGGLAYYFALISWVSLFLGLEPLAALAGLESIYVALGSGLIALAYRYIPAVWTSRWGRIGILPVVVAAAWTAREAVSNTFPYGGFAWGRVSLSQSTGPFAYLAAWVGLSGLTFLLVWLVAFAIACAVEPSEHFWRLPDGVRALRRAGVLPRVFVTVLAAGLVLAIPAIQPRVTGTYRVAGVQANTHSGYFQHVDYVGQILQQNVQATVPVLTQGADLIVWPEGASDLSPLASSVAATDWDDITTLANAPLLGGAITTRGGKFYNSSLLWLPGSGLDQIYDKVHPVPFGEYVPDRAFWTPLAPDLLKLIGRDYTLGTRPSVMDIDGVRVGVDICFDIADDGLILGSIADGAQVLVAQTNNADFGHTDENQQQLAIARMRAIETGRSIVSVSTVSSTTAIGPDGRTLAALKPFTRGTLVANVPLATGTTPAVAFGVLLGILISLFGALVPIGTMVLAKRPPRPAPSDG